MCYVCVTNFLYSPTDVMSLTVMRFYCPIIKPPHNSQPPHLKVSGVRIYHTTQTFSVYGEE